LILHFSKFTGADLHTASDTWILKSRGVVTTYAVALVASTSLLWFFGKFDDQPLDIIIAQAVILSVPAVLGASAGRLLLQTNNSD
jgi:uncharacterized membrane protein